MMTAEKNSLRGKVWPDWPLILAYHSISDQRLDGLAVRTGDFERQIRWLSKKGYRSLTLTEYLYQGWRKGERVVIITFDDGYRDVYTQAFPILRNYGFKAVVFLVDAYIDQEHVYWWDQEKVNHFQDRSLFFPLRWKEIDRMVEAGFEMGSHTLTHPKTLTELDPERCWEEVAESKVRLEARLAVPVNSFCYPRGDLNEEVLSMVERAGYSCGVVTPPRYGIPLSRYTLRRISLYREYTDLQYRFMTTSLFRRHYEKFKRLRRILMPWIPAPVKSNQGTEASHA